MASRTNISNGIAGAQLDGRARYHLTNHTPPDEALAALREIGATPEQIRQAADTARTYYAARHPLEARQGRDIAELLERLL